MCSSVNKRIEVKFLKHEMIIMIRYIKVGGLKKLTICYLFFYRRAH